MKKDVYKQRRSVDILSKLLAEENITIVHDSNASTASFYPAERKLVFPTYGDQISSVAQTGLALHETGHATDSPVELLELSKKYGHSLINILEDVRIEKIVKSKFPGSRKFFAKSYDELILEHNFFGTAMNENPFDFNDRGFLDRVNCYFKVGKKALVEFSDSEQVLVDKIAAIETIDDLEEVAKELKEIADQNSSAPEHNWGDDDGSDDFDPEDVEWREAEDGEESEAESSASAPAPESDEEPETEESDEGDSEESDDGEEAEEGSESSEGDSSEESDDGEESEGDDGGSSEEGESEEEGAEADGSDGEESEGDGEDGEESEGDDAEGDDGDSDGDTGEGNDNGVEPGDVDLNSDDLEESETERAAKEALEKLARQAGEVGRLVKTKEIGNRCQPWSDIEPWVMRILEDGYTSKRYYYQEDTEGWMFKPDYVAFRKEIKPILNKMVSEFNRQAAATVSRRTAFKDTGVLDPNKMVHYRYNENIFRKRKFVRDGKNHGVMLFVDFTGSMGGRIKPIMRQVMLMVEFCRKVNLPFRVYGWSDRYLPGNFIPDDTVTPGRPSGRYYGRNFDGVAITEILSSKMPEATLEKFSYWALSGCGMTPGGSTPLVSASYYALALAKKFRKEHAIDIMKFMLFTDGEGHTTLPSWGADSWIDEETGTQYSNKELRDDYYAASDNRYLYGGSEDQQLFFLSKVLKDRCNADTIFMYMNYTKAAYKRFRSGMFSDEELKVARKSYREFGIAKVGERGPFTFVGINDDYSLATGQFELKVNGDESDRQLKTAFSKAAQNRKASTLFATIAAECLAE